MTRLSRSAIVAVTALLSAVPASARPDLRQGRAIATVTVYPDDVRRSLFYYAPGDLAVATGEDGAPELRLLSARYTGSVVNRDQGAALVRSLLTVRVRLNGPTAAEVAAARRILSAEGTGSPELRPLPIRRLESAIVYAPAGGTGDEAVLPAGHYEAPDAAAAQPDGFWSERVYTLRLGAEDAQLLASALEHGQVAFSIGFAFLADGIGPDQPLQQLTGSPALVGQLSQLIAGSQPPATADTAPHVVRAGAVAVTADARHWPRIISRVDINESAPPLYAALDIYCYDFTAGGPAALYERQVEIEAAGVGGAPVALTRSFSRAQPDVYAHSVRFPVAVRLDRPYRFRVTDIAADGTVSTGSWREQASWTALLDVTSQGERK